MLSAMSLFFIFLIVFFFHFFFFFFFFQAEDGIRDFHVTGVQTCALPISDGKTAERREAARVGRRALRCERAAGGPRRDRRGHDAPRLLHRVAVRVLELHRRLPAERNAALSGSRWLRGERARSCRRRRHAA